MYSFTEYSADASGTATCRQIALSSEMFDKCPKTGPYAWLTWRHIFMTHFAKLASGCWEWTGQRFPNGYGKFSFRLQKLLAHRVSYALHKGFVPAGQIVRHSCDYRPCVNPDHLLLGSQKQNVDDAWERGRVDRRNLGAGRRKLTTDQVQQIRAIHGMLPQKEIAAMFEVRPNHISRILSRTRRSLEIGQTTQTT